MVKLADTQDLESCGAIRIGSNPFDGIRHTPPIYGRGFCVSALSCTLAFSCEPAHLKKLFFRPSCSHIPIQDRLKNTNNALPLPSCSHISTQDRLKENADNALPLPSCHHVPIQDHLCNRIPGEDFPDRLHSTDDAAFILSAFSAPVVQFCNNPFPISHEFFSASGK